ncbi:amidase [Litoreibacter janthinus]|uniref:Asp-tRNAAsn/Glu-tRNAGln amidotransferase A subunit n=1 Tax=Litoreibacter janthinus TaxID=670154 RepID=A0A1I6GS93_9RHOB|nr:amidase [Litoreibacter janthinus]SFR45058.1 Asp-tRNAAsn/Glu-tRNAGln amidotransferase A subunit [Litoreibacter janthinus]
MSGSKLCALSAGEVLAAFAAKSLTPSEYLAACLEQITQFNPKINALAAMDVEGAVVRAEEATRRWQSDTPMGPLDGLPIGVKDLQDTKGLLTTHGSIRARGHVPNDDMPMVARLRAAGAIIFAKTNVPEVGAGGNSRNPVWGATGNPFDANLIAGGSSGGSAAALAANLLPLCTGSDTGGSLRMPAALCGIVGYRPSVGVIAHPTRPLGWSGISVLGPMARTMDDLTLMLGVCQGHDWDDPLSVSSVPDRFEALPPVSLKDLRVGFSEDFGGAPVEPTIRQTFRARLDLLRPHVKECRLVDLNLGDMDRCFDVLRAESFGAAFGAGVQEDPDGFGPHIKENVALGQTMSLADRGWAHNEQTHILRRFNALMREVDVIVLPTSPVSPFAWTQSHPARIDGQDMDIYYRWLALCYRGSLSGGPAITLPCGRDAFGMPFGLQMLAAVRGDEQLLSAAKAIEGLFAAEAETARPLADMKTLALSKIDLRSIVTHPPILAESGQSARASLQTAV